MCKKLGVSMLAVLFFLISFVLFGKTAFYDEDESSQIIKNVQLLNSTNKIKDDLNKATKLINAKGTEAFKEIADLNEKDNAGIFVIDPSTGKILIAPKVVYDKDSILFTDNINTKLLVDDIREMEAQADLDRKGFMSYFSGRDADLFPGGYAARTVISPSWKAYVVFTNKNTLQMEKLFISRTISKACKIIQEQGFESAIKEFDKEGTRYRTNNSYIWIYDTNGVCLYNPVYPEIVGKNVITDNSLVGDYRKYVPGVIKTALDKGRGQFDYFSRKPGGGKGEGYRKLSLYRLVESDGKKYIVGTGIYIVKREKPTPKKG